MKWLLILAFLTYDEHLGEFNYSAGKPWTIIFKTRAECLKARDEAVDFALKWQRTERDGETSAVSICIKEHNPVAASLPRGMQRPSHGGPPSRAIIGPDMQLNGQGNSWSRQHLKQWPPGILGTSYASPVGVDGAAVIELN
jgi:hypothetical protein